MSLKVTSGPAGVQVKGEAIRLFHQVAVWFRHLGGEEALGPAAFAPLRPGELGGGRGSEGLGGRGCDTPDAAVLGTFTWQPFCRDK